VECGPNVSALLPRSARMDSPGEVRMRHCGETDLSLVVDGSVVWFPFHILTFVGIPEYGA
jgi:hypothetical protein